MVGLLGWQGEKGGIVSRIDSKVNQLDWSIRTMTDITLLSTDLSLDSEDESAQIVGQ